VAPYKTRVAVVIHTCQENIATGRQTPKGGVFMKSNVRKIMEEKNITIRDLMVKIDEMFPRTYETGNKKGQILYTSSKTIMNARDDGKIESCTLATLKMIARALGVSVHDLFFDRYDSE
jgi:DNA-binding Xre family transcriptional regulator